MGKDAFDRTAAMVDAGLDVVFIDVAHAHTRDVIGTVSHIRQQRSSEVQIVAGNVMTADAARSLVDAGADAIKIGICNAGRQISGVGMPPFTAVLQVAEQCAMMGVPAIAGGGIKDAAALAKAIGAGAESAVIDHLFAGADEAPGQIVYHGDHAYKLVHPASKAPSRSSAPSTAHDPYLFDGEMADISTPYRGDVAHVVQQLLGGLKSAMAYSGSKDVQAMIENAEFVRIK
ncbi:MAG: IMP dehydrogenase [Proteobacteria bacterium]|nr:IMP dehydrogenase [Pseudomonadota bacterium]